MNDDEVMQELRDIEAVAAMLGELTPLARLDADQAAEVRERVSRALEELDAASEVMANAVDVAAVTASGVVQVHHFLPARQEVVQVHHFLPSR
jgi:hypothetical protein